MTMIKPSARHKARRFAVQALYQWHFTQRPAKNIREEFLEENNMAKVDMAYFDAITAGTITNIDMLDEKITQLTDELAETSIDELDPLTLTLLRLALFELTERVDVPYSVVIDEAIKLSKLFGAQDSYTFINRLLDQAVQLWRPVEYQQRAQRRKGSDEST